LAGGASEQVTVVVQPDPCMTVGTYQETLRVTGYSDNFEQNIVITLIIT
jgi:uncharacterized membrane protein